MSKLNLGYCGICDIAIFDQVDGRFIPNDQYTELHLVFSDGTIGKNGVCLNCLATATDDQVKLLMERIRETWLAELVGTATDKQFENVETLEVEAHATSYEEIIEKQIEIEEQKEEDRLDEIGPDELPQPIPEELPVKKPKK